MVFVPAQHYTVQCSHRDQIRNGGRQKYGSQPASQPASEGGIFLLILLSFSSVEASVLYLSQARSIRKQGLKICMGAEISVRTDLLQYILWWSLFSDNFLPRTRTVQYGGVTDRAEMIPILRRLIIIYDRLTWLNLVVSQTMFQSELEISSEVNHH